MFRSCVVVVVAALAFSPFASGSFASEPAVLRYNDHILPILAENCFHCHGPDSGTRKGKLRLDRFEDAISVRGNHDPAIVPGDPRTSLLIERILSTDEDERMPPLESHKKLSTGDVARLHRWIAEGARYEKHWSFTVPTRPAIPQIPLSATWVRTPIDAFVAAKLSENGLAPSVEETPSRLLRRLSFDLTGLPPTPAELAAFVADPSAQAYERAVDRMLASDASAEQFARHWLDAVRYADTHGIHIDNFRSIWPYRDWVVDAFRRNLPFDRFTVEQVAGDMIPAATLEQKIASGFNRCLPTTSEGGAIAEEYEAIYAKDRVETLSTVWLGLTTGCAACHDHKFDPITQRDFYSLTAFFRNNTMMAMDGNRADPPPTLFIPAPEDRKRWPELQSELSTSKRELQARAKNAETDYAAWLATATTLAVPPADRRTSLHLPLNRPGEIGSMSQASLHATTPTTPAIEREGIYGPAPRINGLDLVLGPAAPWVNETAESFSFLIRVSDVPQGTVLACRSEDDTGPGWELFLEKGMFGIHLSSGPDGYLVHEVATEALAPDRWHHVLLSFDASSARSRVVDLFVDGKSLINSGNSSRLPAKILPTAPLRLGSRGTRAGPGVSKLVGGDVFLQDLRRTNRPFSLADARAMATVLIAPEALKTPADQRTLAQDKALRAHYFAAVDGPSLAITQTLDRLGVEEEIRRVRGALTLVMEEKTGSEPFAFVLNRGEYSQPTEKVMAATPGMLPGLPAGIAPNRLALANWLVSPENPLTARVTVNRLWQQLMGVGLVESSGDFGVMGSRPSHPQLLDWLAVDFRESGWDVRRLVRGIVTTATYRQSARISPELLERDPDNRLLARGPRSRLDAEQLRDQALSASGLLVSKLHGRPVKPYQPEGIWEEVAMKESTTRFYQVDSGGDLYRRSLYTLWKRTAAPPAMEILNAPTREVSCVRRDRTNTPLQALVTMNEPLFIETSRQLASRALREASSVDGRLDVVSLRLLGRPLAESEKAILKRTLDEALAAYRGDPGLAAQLLAVGASPADKTLPVPELAAWTLLASQVMNLDESLTK